MKVVFATNINCGGCIAKVTPFINAVEGVINWSVDTTHPQKILMVETKNQQAEKIIEAVRKAGFQIERLPSEE